MEGIQKPSVGCIADNQSVKTVEKKGFADLTQIKELRVGNDTYWLIITAAVGFANCTDRDGLDALCRLNKSRIKLPKKVYADLGYSGEDMKDRMAMHGIEIKAVGRKSKKTFEVEPKRWIVERTFA